MILKYRNNREDNKNIFLFDYNIGTDVIDIIVFIFFSVIFRF